MRGGGINLGYRTESTPHNRLKVIQEPDEWIDLSDPSTSDYWYLIPNNSLVKIPHPKGSDYGWHWVVWRKEKIYDPARGVFHPSKYSAKPASYMHFMKKEIVYV